MRTSLFTFILIVLSSSLSCLEPQKSSNKKQRIVIVPIDVIDSALLTGMKKRIQECSNLTIDIDKVYEPPSNSVNHERKRYIADTLLQYLNSIKPAYAHKIIGITTHDIESNVGKKKNWGVMGLGYQPGGSCVVSTFRPSRKVSTTKLLDRMITLTLHELGHTYSLDHCSDQRCIMQDANGGMRLDFSKGFCTCCREVLNLHSLEFYAQDNSGYSQHTENK